MIYTKNMEKTLQLAIESKRDLLECDTPQMRRQILRTVYENISVWIFVFSDDQEILEYLESIE